jgi:hypothetical protein
MLTSVPPFMGPLEGLIEIMRMLVNSKCNPAEENVLPSSILTSVKAYAISCRGAKQSMVVLDIAVASTLVRLNAHR